MRGAGNKPLSRSLRIYQKVAIVFVIIAVLLLLAVLYLSISQAVISITPNPQVVSSTIAAEIATDPGAINQIDGLVVQKTVTKAKEFTLPEEGGTAVESKAGGTVTLINETNIDQPLVATTRLLSEEGVLFRIDNAVNIPANGQIETVAHADEMGASGDIGPSQFTIPGLPASAQEVVYAVSVEPMTGGVSYVRVLSQDDLDQAVADLSDEILAETKDMLREQAAGAGYDGEAFETQVVEQVSDTEPGTETGSFTISVTARVTGVFYPTSGVAEFAQANLLNQASDGFVVTSVKEDGLQVTVQSIDTERSVATVSIYLDGFAVIAQNNELLDKDRFTGRSANEIVTMLEAADSIENAAVSFTPFWLKRVPTLKDHIKIIIENEVE